MTQEQYIRQILRRIRVTDKTRQRIRTDLLADMAAKEEAGQTPEQIQAGMGSPEQVAAEFNASFAGTDAELWYRWQQRTRLAAILLLVLTVLSLVFSPGTWVLVSRLMWPSVGVIGGADGPTQVYVTDVTVTGNADPLVTFLALGGLPAILAVLAAACLVAWLVIRSHRS